MTAKYKSAIEKVMLNAATFDGVEVEPTFINFFYGNNGTGKSTIARVIDPTDAEMGKPADLLWEHGKTAADYTVLVYNQEFVDRNLNYGHLKGVFTLGEKNIQIQNRIAEMNADKAEVSRRLTEHTTSQTAKTTDKNTLTPAFQEKCWSKTKTDRDYFADALGGFKTKKNFADKILELTVPTSPPPTLADLRTLYDTAFSADARTYPLFQALDLSRLQGAEEYPLLGRAIISSGNTEYSRFIQALNATSWVKTGHDNYAAAAEGRCPYCRQKLPRHFEDEIAACFDKTYDEEVDKLVVYQKTYADYMQSLIDALERNKQDLLPTLDLTSYDDKIATLRKTVELNNQRVAEKVKAPSEPATIDSVRTLLDEINTIIAVFNKKIQANNDVVTAKAQKQAEFKRMMWEYFASELHNEVSSYKTSVSKINGDLDTLNKQIGACNLEIKRLTGEINKLNEQVVSTTRAVTDINAFLHDSGFQGFSLREKKNQPNAYEVVRSDGSIAVKLSEGERNFIAFLYFHQLVRGSQYENDLGKDKIVVVDDPVSSLDSSVLFIVSTLLREFIEVCYANLRTPEPGQPKDDYIKQLFVLTHNVYFHKEITYNQASRYKAVSFFIVNKFDNKSRVKLCVQNRVDAPTLTENYNPVQNSYAALWSEYKELDKPITVLNVIRRILDYYFIQLCGYDGGNLHDQILKKNRAKFVVTADDGKEDTTKYRLAQLMMSYINSNSREVSDGLYHIDEGADIQLCKNVFRMIFKHLGQEQHYRMMIGEDDQ